MYTLYRFYADCSSSGEKAKTISDALSAAAIYLEDPECKGFIIWLGITGEIVCEFTRP